MVVSITAFRDVAAGETLLASIPGIDATADATTNLYTVPSGQTVVVTKVVLRVTAFDTLTVNPVIGVGIAAGEDDIFFPQTIDGLTAVGDTWTFDSQAKAVDGVATEVIKLGIDTFATATTLTLAADIFGYFVGGTSASLPPVITLAQAVLNPTQSLAHNTTTPLANWTTEIAPSSKMTISSDRITANVAGVYRVTAIINWAPNGTGLRETTISHYNSADVLQSSVYDDRAPVTTGNSMSQDTSWTFSANAGDYFQVSGFQSSGVSLDAQATNTRFQVEYIGAQDTGGSSGGSYTPPSWVSFTPTGTWTTNVAYTGMYRQVGDTLDVQVRIGISGTPDNDYLSVDPPTGFTIDTTKFLADHHLVGDAVLFDSGTSFYLGKVLWDGAILRVMRVYTAASWFAGDTARIDPSPIAGRDQVNQTTPFPWVSGDWITLRYSVPVNDV